MMWWTRGVGAGVLAVVAAVVMWVGTGAASAAPTTCTDTWLATAGSGSWGTAADWSTGKPPESGDVACINQPGTYTVTLSSYTPPELNSRVQGGDTVASLIVGGGASGTQSLVISGQSFTDSSGTVNSIGLDVTGTSTIAANGAVTLDATGGGSSGAPLGAKAVFDAGTLANAGTITTQVEDAQWTARIGGAITNTGTINVNSGSLVMPSADEGGTGSTGGASLNNTGTINVAANAEFNVDEVQGAAASSVTQNGTIANAGTIVAQANNTGASTLVWNQAGGTETGNPVHIQTGALLNDAAGSGSFLFDGQGAGLEGTIPSSQSVTLDGESYTTSMNETSNVCLFDLQGQTLTNDGTLTIDSTNTGPATPLGAGTEIQHGAITNAGTLNLNVDSGSQYGNQLDVSVTNQHGASLNVSGPNKSTVTAGGIFTNDGTITVTPGATFNTFANPFLSGPETANLNSDGTIIPQIASATSFGVFSFGANATINLAGAVAPALLNGYVPTASQEFAIFPNLGVTINNKFTSVTNGFNADYTNEASNGVPLAYGPVPGTATTAPVTPTPTKTPTTSAAKPAPKAGAAKSAKGTVTVALSCTTAKSCATATAKVTFVETVKKKKVTVLVASGSATLAAHKAKTISLKLTAAGRKLLARRHSLTGTLTVTANKKTLKKTAIKLTAAKKQAAKHKQR